MQYKKTEKGYIIRLIKGEYINKKLTEFCIDQNIHSGFFSAVGTLSEAEIGFRDMEKKEYIWKKLKKNLEIINITGNIALVQKTPFLHMHTVLSDENYAAIAGHMKDGIVLATCEVYLIDFETDVERKYDDEMKLNLLDLK